MRIAFFITNITHAGGTERMTLSLANEFLTRGYYVTVISLMGEGSPFFEHNKHIKFETIHNTKRNLLLNYFSIVVSLNRILKRNNIDVLIDVVTTMSLFSIPASFLTKTKVITWEHFNFGVDLGRPAMRVGRFVASKFASAIVTLTEADREEYIRRLNCKANVVTIPNFILRTDRIPVGGNSNIAVAVGRLTYQKGFDRLISIWSAFIQNTSYGKHWKLKIIGNGEDKFLLKSEIKRLGMEEYIEILEATKKIDKYYQNASVFLMTSRWEGLPMVLIECQVYGLPVISYDCKTGPSEIISNGENGILVEDGNFDKFLSALIEVTSSDTLRNKLGEGARKRAVFFFPDRIIPLWINLFDNLNTK